MERALRTSESRTTAILRMVPDLMFVMSRDGVYLDYHARDPHALFVPPDQFLGKRMQDIFPPAMARLFQEKFEQALHSDEPVVVEILATHAWRRSALRNAPRPVRQRHDHDDRA